jgi:biotin synthase
MGAAWRGPRNNQDFEMVLEMVKQVRALGMETCVTLGLLNEDQARRLAQAGLKAYNHNIDTSPEYYSEIITTRTFEDRIRTIEHVRAAGIEVCCGGILGMGESREDRIGMLAVLAAMDPHPESVPINALVAIEGTPLEDAQPVDAIELVRTIATARIAMPHSRVRLSAGRLTMSEELQALCFAAGANSIFAGERLLTTANPGVDKDSVLLEKLGMRPQDVGSPESARAAAHHG